MKIISVYDYNIISACKKDDNMFSLKDYLMDYYMVNEIDDIGIYHNLSKVIFDISSFEDIKYLFNEEFSQYYQNLNRNRPNASINIKELATLFYYHLYFLEMMECKKKEKNNIITTEFEDIYYVNDNNKYIPYSEYHQYQKIKRLN